MNLRLATAAVALGSALLLKQKQASKRSPGAKHVHNLGTSPRMQARKPTTEPTSSSSSRLSMAFALLWLLLLAWAAAAAKLHYPGSVTRWLLVVTVAALVLTLYVTRHTLPQTSNKQQLLNDSPMQEAAKAAVSLQRLEGEWIKDKQRSSDMGPAMDLVRLNPLVKKAITLVTGVLISLTETEIQLAVTCKVPWFKIVEAYSLAGLESQHRRRDLRRGLHTGRVEVTPQGELLIFIQWGDPHGGIGQERYHLTDEDTLVCDVQFTVGDRTAAYQIVHTRRYR